MSKKVTCDKCQLIRVNGIVTHEQGCPDAWKSETRKCKSCESSSSPPTRTNIFAGISVTKTTMVCGSHVIYGAIFEDYNSRVIRYTGFDTANQVRRWWRIHGSLVNRKLIGVEQAVCSYPNKVVIDFTFTKVGRQFANSLKGSLFP